MARSSAIVDRSSIILRSQNSSVLPFNSMRDIQMDAPAQEFMGVNFPSLEYSLDMLSEFQPQQPTDLFVPTISIAPLDFVNDLFPLPSVPADPQPLAELPASPPAKQEVSSSSSGSPVKERKGSRERQSSGRWSTREKGPVSDARKLEVNREAQRRFRQRQKVQPINNAAPHAIRRAQV